MESQKIVEECQEVSKEFEVPDYQEEILDISDVMIVKDNAEDNLEWIEEEETEVFQKSDIQLPYLGLIPRMCHLCDLEFESTPEDHFLQYHQLVKIERCTK